MASVMPMVVFTLANQPEMFPKVLLGKKGGNWESKIETNCVLPLMKFPK